MKSIVGRAFAASLVAMGLRSGDHANRVPAGAGKVGRRGRGERLSARRRGFGSLCGGAHRQHRITPALTALVLVACSGDKPVAPALPTPVPTSIQLSVTAVSLRISEIRHITATVIDQQNRPMSNQSITWHSSDTTRLTIDATGNAVAIRSGPATLTARSGSLTASVAGTVLAPTARVEQTAAVSATIGPAGGRIDARGSNGVRFTLSVPAHALETNTAITVTPITSIDNMPNGLTVLGAVRLQPDGLAFLVPVVVTMDLPAAPNASRVSGMRTSDDGTKVALTPVTLVGSRLTMTIAHFTNAVSTDGTCLPPLTPIVGETAADIALGDLAYLQCQAGSGLINATAVINILHKWYTTSVKPGLQSATTTATATTSFADWVQWRHTVDAYLPVLGPISAINADVAEAETLAADVVKGEIARLNQHCIANQDLSAAEKVFFWQTRAQGELLVTSGNGLDLASVKAGLCVKVEIGQTDFPAVIAAGETASLVVRSGLRFGTGPVVYTPSLKVSVTASGASAGGAQTTDGSGMATVSVTADAGGGTVHLAVRAALTSTSLESYGVFGSTSIVRQASGVTLAITPVAAALNPGTQASFSATVTGSTNQAVTWSATGGTITQSGQYTAGSTLGTFQVKATSVAVPSRSATATITILNNLVYATGFSGTVGPEWSPASATTSPSGERFLGRFANQTVSLNLSGFAPHTRVTIELDLYILGSWNGGADDVMTITTSTGDVLLHSSFSNRFSDRQHYPSPIGGPTHPAATGAQSTNTLGYQDGSEPFGFSNAIYRLAFTFAHNASGISFNFRSSVTNPSGEQFGIDNVKVIILP